MSSYVVSPMLFLLLIVFSLHMDDAFGAQTEIRKLKETIKLRRNLEGDDQRRSSKIGSPPSTTRKCRGKRTFQNMATTNGPGHGQFRPLPQQYSSSPCISGFSCYTIRCTTTKRCHSFNGSPMACTTSENCVHISSGH